MEVPGNGVIIPVGVAEVGDGPFLISIAHCQVAGDEGRRGGDVGAGDLGGGKEEVMFSLKLKRRSLIFTS